MDVKIRPPEGEASAELMKELRRLGQIRHYSAKHEPSGQAGSVQVFYRRVAGSRRTIKLNIGSGAVPKEGYLNVDLRDMHCVDIVCDVFNLTNWIPDGYVSEIYSKDFIEHVSWRKAAELWKLFRRLLTAGGPGRQGGKLDILTPDLGLILARYKSGGFPWPWAMQCLYGLQTYEQNFHRALYDYATLSTQLTGEGFVCKHLPNEGNLMHLVAIRQ